MTEHLRTYHQQVVFLDGSDAGGSTSTQKWLLKRKQHLVKSSCCWNTVVWNVQGQQVAIRFLKRDDIWYTFVVVFGDDAAAAKIKCEVRKNTVFSNWSILFWLSPQCWRCCRFRSPARTTSTLARFTRCARGQRT